MNRTSKTILTLGSVFLSVVLLLSSPALAKNRSGSAKSGARVSRSRSGGSRKALGLRSGRRSAVAGRIHHGGRGGRRDRHNLGSRFGISFGLGTRYYHTSYRRWVPGRYQIHLERVLVEPGHYEWQTQRVQVEPGRYEVRQIPAVEQTRSDKEGKPYTIIVEPARTETVWIPPRYEERKVQVWIPDRYEQEEVRVWTPGYWVIDSAYAPGRYGSWFRFGGNFRF